MYQENKQGIFVPSLKLEKKTKVFNKYIWLPVVFLNFVLALISFVFYEMIKSVLNIVYSFYSEHLLIVLAVFMVLLLGSIPNFCSFIFQLWTSYEFSDGKIVKGRITFKAFDYGKINTIATDAIALGGMLKKLENSSQVQASRAAGEWGSFIALTRLNLNKAFVEQVFDTDAYKRTEYENPRFIRETRYSQIYQCEDKKRLVIPKIYEGLIETPERKESSLWTRILGKGLLAGAILFLLATIDVGINFNRNPERLDAIENTRVTLGDDLENFSFEKDYNGVFQREEHSGYCSSVKYSVNKEGQVTDVDFQLYYDKNSKNVAEELEYILSTVPTAYNEVEKAEFIQNVIRSIEDTFTYDVLETRNSKVIIGTSSGFIDVHNY